MKNCGNCGRSFESKLEQQVQGHGANDKKINDNNNEGVK